MIIINCLYMYELYHFHDSIKTKERDLIRYPNLNTKYINSYSKCSVGMISCDESTLFIIITPFPFSRHWLFSFFSGETHTSHPTPYTLHQIQTVYSVHCRAIHKRRPGIEQANMDRCGKGIADAQASIL